jgi:putative ABC transport system permease protein
VVVELALALVVLVGAGLLTRSFVFLRGVDPGFAAEGVQVSFVSLPQSRYPEASDRRRAAAEILAAVEAAGGRPALATNLPFSGVRASFGFDLPDVAEDAAGSERTAEYHTVSGPYFQNLEIPLRSGRVFDRRDDAGATPVAVVNEEMAQRFWPGRDPLGQRLVMFGDHVERRIVGVVGNIRHFGRTEAQPAEVYVPFAQDPWSFFHLVARPGAAEAAALPEVLRGAVLAAGLPVDSVTAMTELVAADLAPMRFQMLLIALFGAVALVLATSGLYGVIAYSSSQRTHEVAVRLALGADRRHILWQFLGQGLALTVAGLFVGTLGALAASRLLTGFLYGVEPWDPVTFAAIAAVLTAVSLAATLRPARKATLRDPMASLRSE